MGDKYTINQHKYCENIVLSEECIIVCRDKTGGEDNKTAEIVWRLLNEHEARKSLPKIENKITIGQLKILSEKATQNKWVIKKENVVSDEGDSEMCYYYRGKLVMPLTAYIKGVGDGKVMSESDVEFMLACVNYVKDLLADENGK